MSLSSRLSILYYVLVQKHLWGQWLCSAPDLRPKVRSTCPGPCTCLALSLSGQDKGTGQVRPSTGLLMDKCYTRAAIWSNKASAAGHELHSYPLIVMTTPEHCYTAPIVLDSPARHKGRLPEWTDIYPTCPPCDSRCYPSAEPSASSPSPCGNPIGRPYEPSYLWRFLSGR